MRLHRGLQDAAERMGFEYKLKLQLEEEADVIEAGSHGSGTLVVLALERKDHASQGVVHGRIRLSTNPMLVVCQG